MLGGCASAAKQKKPQTRPAARVIGKVSLVNDRYGFALVDATAAPPPGTFLKTFSSTKETGELRVSPERRPPFLIGDIVHGAPAMGDAVLYQPKFEPATSPAAPAVAPAPAGPPLPQPPPANRAGPGEEPLPSL